jgi:endonuclease/exonuclease/phosphatase family metal-dependent hydrolase
MRVHALTWNLFHGRDFPPDPSLFTRRSRLLRITERNDTHVQVNRDLFDEFASVLCGAEWDVALLQECPPRWAEPFAAACAAEAHGVLTSRNSIGAVRSLLARINPDLIASNEGGSNLMLVRGGFEIVERRELELYPGPEPERRVMGFTRVRRDGTDRLCVANTHLTARRSRRDLAERELLDAAKAATAWAASDPLILGGDFNVRPSESTVYELLAEHYSLTGITSPRSLDHLLARGLEPEGPRRAWAPDEREVQTDAGAIRLSDHAPVEATFSAGSDIVNAVISGEIRR